MKKFFVFAMMMAMTMCVTSCGGDDPVEDESKKSAEIEAYLLGKEWKVNGGSLSLYKNHMAYYDFGAGVGSGAQTVGTSVYFGSWSVTKDVLSVSFSANTSVDIPASSANFTHRAVKSPLGGYGFIDVKGSPNDTIWYKWVKTERDFTDASEHDGALHGAWKMQVGASDGSSATCVMTFYDDGTVNYNVDNGAINVTDKYLTKNGIVTLGNFPFGNKDVRYFYTRTDESFITFWSTENGYRVFTVYKNL